jgi:hypothetical protein
MKTAILVITDPGKDGDDYLVFLKIASMISKNETQDKFIFITCDEIPITYKHENYGYRACLLNSMWKDTYPEKNLVIITGPKTTFYTFDEKAQTFIDNKGSKAITLDDYVLSSDCFTEQTRMNPLWTYKVFQELEGYDNVYILGIASMNPIADLLKSNDKFKYKIKYCIQQGGDFVDKVGPRTSYNMRLTTYENIRYVTSTLSEKLLMIASGTTRLECHKIGINSPFLKMIQEHPNLKGALPYFINLLKAFPYKSQNYPEYGEFYPHDLIVLYELLQKIYPDKIYPHYDYSCFEIKCVKYICEVSKMFILDESNNSTFRILTTTRSHILNTNMLFLM